MKKGYTLAETLITLAIIGVIAGLLFPVMQKNTPNREMLAFKKAYSSVERAIAEMINDEAMYSEGEGFADTRGVIYEGKTYRGETKFCGLLAAKLGATCDDNGTFQTGDGMIWTVQEADFENGEESMITVDVDGEQGENAYEDTATKIADRFGIFVGRYANIHAGSSENSIERIYINEDDTTRTFKELKK